MDAFDELRGLRNRSEYGALLVDPGDVADALADVETILGAVGNDV